MTIEERRERDRAARRQLIVTTARRTCRSARAGMRSPHVGCPPRSSTASPCSTSTSRTMEDDRRRRRPVEGFRELAESLSNARRGAAEPEHALRRIAHAYIDFAIANPAVYDAMFTRATTLHFAASDTPPELSAAFAELRARGPGRRRHRGRRHGHRNPVGRAAWLGHSWPKRATSWRTRFRACQPSCRTICGRDLTGCAAIASPPRTLIAPPDV